MAFGTGVSSLLVSALDALVDFTDVDLVSFHVFVHQLAAAAAATTAAAAA